MVERVPIQVWINGDTGRFEADPRMDNGWTYSNRRMRADLGAHHALQPFVVGLLSGNAESAWAVGVEPNRPQPLGQEFAFDAFLKTSNREVLCRRLATLLTHRIKESPSPGQAFVGAMGELKMLGHDLWSWDDDVYWGPDYVTRRPDAGLVITRYGEDSDDDEGAEDDAELVSVEFRPPE